MRGWPALIVTLLLEVAFAAPLHADSLTIDNKLLDQLTLLSCADGHLNYLTANQRPGQIPITKIQTLSLDKLPTLQEAEKQFAAHNFPQAITLYQQSLQQAEEDHHRQIIQYRLLHALDVSGQYVEALKLFFRLAAQSPSTDTFTLRPSQLPPANSQQLTTAAQLLDAQLANPQFQAPALQKQLNFWLLEIYQQTHDPRAASLAQKLAPQSTLAPEHTGILSQESPTNTTPTASPLDPNLASALLQKVETAFAAHDYPATIQSANTALSSLTGASARRLFTLKAQSYEALHQPHQAALAYFSIYAFYAQSAPRESQDALTQVQRLMNSSAPPAPALPASHTAP